MFQERQGALTGIELVPKPRIQVGWQCSNPEGQQGDAEARCQLTHRNPIDRVGEHAFDQDRAAR